MVETHVEFKRYDDHDDGDDGGVSHQCLWRTEYDGHACERKDY